MFVLAYFQNHKTISFIFHLFAMVSWLSFEKIKPKPFIYYVTEKWINIFTPISPQKTQKCYHNLTNSVHTLLTGPGVLVLPLRGTCSAPAFARQVVELRVKAPVTSIAMTVWLLAKSLSQSFVVLRGVQQSIYRENNIPLAVHSDIKL